MPREPPKVCETTAQYPGGLSFLLQEGMEARVLKAAPNPRDSQVLVTERLNERATPSARTLAIARGRKLQQMGSSLAQMASGVAGSTRTKGLAELLPIVVPVSGTGSHSGARKLSSGISRLTLANFSRPTRSNRKASLPIVQPGKDPDHVTITTAEG